MNAYEDLVNGIPLTDTPNSDIAGLILNTAHFVNGMIQADPELPNSPPFCKAMAGPEHTKWHTAILEELVAIKDTRTWELIDHSLTVHNVIGCCFVLQKKRGPDGEVTRYKAHLVAQGFGQQEGIDYLETFAPIVKSVLLHVFLAICT